MVTRGLVLLSLLACSHAYSNTHPLVAWTSPNSPPLPVIASPSYIESALESILNAERICEHDVIIIVDQPGLHASDLRTLSPYSPLSFALENSESSIQLPYLRREPESTAALDLVFSVSRRCDLPAVTVWDDGIDRLSQFVGGMTRYIAYVEPLVLEEKGWKRSRDINRRSQIISDRLLSLTLSIPIKHLVLLTGRQGETTSLEDLEDLEDLPVIPPSSLVAPNSTLPTGGILKRYQLLTPALITTLIVALGILVPVVFLGISALASIQAPARMEPPKKFNAVEKKTQ
ncbi:hypothetical protein NEOLEDRAFT_1100447 [Neolentinus lepideus HHB14362 ss-1]|uniref:Protein BIG1 n=1 Tax=Neolentinus lepideus HHB14362 ss-1 TaxID=1314782 RepID=A0A165P727_9AGAM|nr:hypothetical protein NEOLEDRAFT_1100447 [Neolentinus lepideus HHB14362 ss-1]